MKAQERLREDREALERDRETLDRERETLDRERDRERETLERDRGTANKAKKTEEFQGVHHACACHILNRPIKQRWFAVDSSRVSKEMGWWGPSPSTNYPMAKVFYDWTLKKLPGLGRWATCAEEKRAFWTDEGSFKITPLLVKNREAQGEWSAHPYYQHHFGKCCLCRMSVCAMTKWQPYHEVMMIDAQDLMMTELDQDPNFSLEGLVEWIENVQTDHVRERAMKLLKNVLFHYARITQTQTHNGVSVWDSYDCFKFYSRPTLEQFMKESLQEAKNQLCTKINIRSLRTGGSYLSAKNILQDFFHEDPETYLRSMYTNDYVLHVCVIPRYLECTERHGKTFDCNKYPYATISEATLQSSQEEIANLIDSQLSDVRFAAPPLIDEFGEDVDVFFKPVVLPEKLQERDVVLYKVLPNNPDIGLCLDNDIYAIFYEKIPTNPPRTNPPRTNPPRRTVELLECDEILSGTDEESSDESSDDDDDGESVQPETIEIDEINDSDVDKMNIDLKMLAGEWRLKAPNGRPLWTAEQTPLQYLENCVRQLERDEGDEIPSFTMVSMPYQSGKTNLTAFTIAIAKTVGFPSIVVTEYNQNATELTKKLRSVLKDKNVNVRQLSYFKPDVAGNEELKKHLQNCNCVVINVKTSISQIERVSEVVKSMGVKRGPFLIIDEADAINQSSNETIPQTEEECRRMSEEAERNKGRKGTQDGKPKKVEYTFYKHALELEPSLVVCISATLKKIEDAALNNHFYWGQILKAKRPCKVYFDSIKHIYDPERTTNGQWVYRDIHCLAEVKDSNGEILTYRKAEKNGLDSYWTPECEHMMKRFWNSENNQPGNIMFIRIMHYVDNSGENNYRLCKKIQMLSFSKPCLWVVLNQVPYIYDKGLTDIQRKTLEEQGWRLSEAGGEDNSRQDFWSNSRETLINQLFEMPVFRQTSKVLLGWTGVSRSTSINTEYSRIKHCICRVIPSLWLNEVNQLLNRPAGWQKCPPNGTDGLRVEIMTDTDPRKDANILRPLERCKRDASHIEETRTYLGNQHLQVLDPQVYRNSLQFEMHESMDMERETRYPRQPRSVQHSQASGIRKRPFSQTVPILNEPRKRRDALVFKSLEMTVGEMMRAGTIRKVRRGYEKKFYDLGRTDLYEKMENFTRSDSDRSRLCRIVHWLYEKNGGFEWLNDGIQYDNFRAFHDANPRARNLGINFERFQEFLRELHNN